MVATTKGSGNFETISFDSTLGPKPEPMGVTSLMGDINFTWNKNLQVNGDTVTFSQGIRFCELDPGAVHPRSAAMRAAVLALGLWFHSCHGQKGNSEGGRERPKVMSKAV